MAAHQYSSAINVEFSADATTNTMKFTCRRKDSNSFCRPNAEKAEARLSVSSKTQDNCRQDCQSGAKHSIIAGKDHVEIRSRQEGSRNPRAARSDLVAVGRESGGTGGSRAAPWGDQSGGQAAMHPPVQSPVQGRASAALARPSGGGAPPLRWPPA